ncbi:MAG: hypothetical protein MJZ55_00120 [Paludibacteraceae bacterium]|nr:hypothetical protein [Bacteroidales bacterium]MCQ2330374.1 hypothetical protein [Paludibacteraceae bacterium]
MKKELLLTALVPLLCGCGLIHIVTVPPAPVAAVVTTPTVVTQPAVVVQTQPAPVYTPVYTTTVTTKKVQTVTKATVTAVSQDISLYLDLQAVGAAFAQSNTVQEFENLLNNSSYMLSNLDLNGDGYVDYLRVLETVQGYTHVFLIQAVLAANVYQDVATLVAEVPAVARAYVQIIGDPYIYGPKYIVQPTYIATPYIFNRLVVVNYKPWRSPYYWGYFPACYKRPAPVYITHYQQYITTYMVNHHYCHAVTYPKEYHYAAYAQVTEPIRRNDYARQHPEQDFVQRTSGMSRSEEAGTRSTTVAPTTTASRSANASDIRSQQQATVTTTSTPVSRSATAAKSSTTAKSAAPATTSRATTATTSTGTKTTSTSTKSTTASSTSPSTSRATTATPQTITSKVRTNGSATTTRSAAPTSTSSASTSRSASTSSTSSSRAGSATPTGGASRSAGTAAPSSRATSTSSTRR